MILLIKNIQLTKKIDSLKMIEDRLRPRYSSRSGRPQSLYRGQYAAQTVHMYRTQYAQRSPEQQSLTPQRSPRQRKARAIINKYRKTVRYAQLYRLKSLVPSVRNDEEASEVYYIFLAPSGQLLLY